MLKIQNLSFSFPQNSLLSKLSLHVEEGKIISILGSSGSGKTTLLRLIAGLIQAEEGQILIAGHRHPKANFYLSYMMQEDLLLPWRKTIDNVTVLTELGKGASSRKENRKKAIELLQEVGLKGCENMYPSQLSGGMRQRTALARSLLQNRPLLLLDEPFGALDVKNRESMYRLILQMQKRYNKTLALVTHDFNDALNLSDEIYLLRDGRLEKIWTAPACPLPFSEMLKEQHALRKKII